MKCGRSCNQKKDVWIWIAVDRKTKRILDFEIGSRSQRTFKVLFNRIRLLKPKIIYTDNYSVYTTIIPSSIHKTGKEHTYTVERTNGRIRDYLARFHRKTKSFSKSLNMMKSNLLLLFTKLYFPKLFISL
jgi:IS1 family transposase